MARKTKGKTSQAVPDASRNGAAAAQEERADAERAQAKLEAAERAEAQESSGGRGLGRLLLLLIVVGILALVLSEDVRSKVLDLLFGSEEEFDYSSTTMPEAQPPSAVGAPPSS
ncbi:MAG TPA: hypothetical protein VID29_10475 [Solirubrobacteraceae bacterium]|jgi:hypothetical protein